MLSALATLEARRREPELMDQPGLDEALHGHALSSLRRINWLSRISATLWKPIRRLAAERPLDRPWRILDVACGGGDVSLGLARLATQYGIDVRLDGCDISPFAVRYATETAARQRLGNVSFFERDVLRDGLPGGYDVVVSSLFLHHLDEPDAVRVLRSMAASAGRMVVISDLRRTRLGYALAWLVCRCISRSPVVHVDGPLSVAAAFSAAEMQALADESGLTGASIERDWPQRFRLTWRRP